MNHKMHIDNKSFERIKNGCKRVDLRLYDEKRQNIIKDDIITYINNETNEEIEVEVLYLHIYANFEYLYNDYDKISLGYLSDEEYSHKDMLKYYSIEEQEKNGVVGIEFRVKEGSN